MIKKVGLTLTVFTFGLVGVLASEGFTTYENNSATEIEEVSAVTVETAGPKPNQWSIKSEVAEIQPRPWSIKHEVAEIQPRPWSIKHEVAEIQPNPWSKA